MVTRDYNYSRPLDVHRWSCYTQTNTFVNSIYEQYFLTDKANKKIRKKLLKGKDWDEEIARVNRYEGYIIDSEV